MRKSLMAAAMATAAFAFVTGGVSAAGPAKGLGETAKVATQANGETLQLVRRGGGGGRGWGGGRHRGGGGFGLYLGSAYGPDCWWSHRYHRRICRW